MFVNKYEPAKGRFLVSEPFMDDPNFRRTVVILAEHNEEGSVGYVLTQKLKLKINQIFEGVPEFDAPVYLGGPVGHNTLHFIHRAPLIITGGEEIAPGLFWGGNFDRVKELLSFNLISASDILFFIGYSGWGKGQLNEEIERKSWIIAPENPILVFNPHPEHFWRDVLKSMDEYKHFSNYPIDPNLN